MSDTQLVEMDRAHGSHPVMVPLASPQCAQVCAALALAQGQFEAPQRTKTATVKGKTASGKEYEYTYNYAPLEEVIRVTKEPLAKNGLGRQQYLVSKGNQAFLRTIIWHASGEWIASDYPVFPTKDGHQGFAAGVTYARRYGLSLALGLAPEDDDDGNMADSRPAATRPAQRRTVTKQDAPEEESAPRSQATGDRFPELDESNGTQWTKNLDKLLHRAIMLDDVADLRGDPRVAKAIKGAPTLIRQRIEDMFRETYARLGEPMDADEAA